MVRGWYRWHLLGPHMIDLDIYIHICIRMNHVYGQSIENVSEYGTYISQISRHLIRIKARRERIQHIHLTHITLKRLQSPKPAGNFTHPSKAMGTVNGQFASEGYKASRRVDTRQKQTWRLAICRWQSRGVSNKKATYPNVKVKRNKMKLPIQKQGCHYYLASLIQILFYFRGNKFESVWASRHLWF